MLRFAGRRLLSVSSRDHLGSEGPIPRLLQGVTFKRPEPIAPHEIRKVRLQNNKKWQRDHNNGIRHDFAWCPRCGTSSAVVNFDVIPSAFIGLSMPCHQGESFEKHQWNRIDEATYTRMQSMSATERMTWMTFDRENE